MKLLLKLISNFFERVEFFRERKEKNQKRTLQQAGGIENSQRTTPGAGAMDEAGFVLLRPVESGRPGGGARRLAACVAMAALMAALIAVAATSSPPNVLQAVSAGLNDQFLQASAAGATGKDFLSRLMDIWFVESNAGGRDLAADATKVATGLLVAGFPEDMKAAVDLQSNPCDDFYEFACGKWDDEHKNAIKDYKSQVALSWDRADKFIRESMTSILEKDEGPAGLYYRSCMDTDHIEAVGTAQIQPWIAYIDAIADKDMMVTAITEFNKADMDNFFTWGISTDTRDSSRKSFSIEQGGMTLPDNTYYLEDSAVMRQHRAKMVEVVAKFFTMIGRGDTAQQEAQTILDFETKMAGIRVDRAESRKDQGTLTTWEHLGELMPYWPWKVWLSQLASCTAPPDGSAKVCTADHDDVREVGEPGKTPLYITNEKFFPKLNSLLENTELETVKALLRWKVIRKVALYMPAAWIDLMVEWNADMYGTSAKSPRDHKCYYSTSGGAAWPMAKLYIEKVFHTENRAAALSMLERVRAQFMDTLPTEEWMTEEDRAAAQDKLSAMFFQVAYPTDKDDKTHWPKDTYAMDGKMGADFMTNYMLKERLALERDLSEISEKPDRRSWGGNSPLEVNAFYGSGANGLWIPAGILQSPFFDASNSDARNYGSIGSVLGHEMSHGFDDNGRLYDKRGELHDWWSSTTVTNYEKRSMCIADLFSTYKVDGRAVNGNYTLGEDSADSGGLKFAYEAFVKKEPRSEKEKRVFFTSFAQTWCSVQRKKSAISSVLTDPHAPNKFRVLGGLSQFAPFADAFQCPVGAHMAPAKRCELW